MRHDEATGKLYDAIKAIRVAMMTTETPSGQRHTRPMYALDIDDDGKLWFFTSRSSAKVRELQDKHRVDLAYADPGRNVYAIVAGEGAVVTDRDEIERRWSEGARVWFPNGKSDPDLALICVTPKDAEYWSGPSSTLLHLYGYAKARLVGTPPTELTHDQRLKLG